MQIGYCRVLCNNKSDVIADQVFVADGFFSRLRGLLGRSGLEEGEGLLLSPCSSIHCLGMKFAIDAIFLDRGYCVVAIHENMKPGAMASSRRARYVLELKAGEAARHSVHVGEQLRIEPSTG